MHYNSALFFRDFEPCRGSLLPLIKFEAGFEFLLYEDTELKNLTSVIVAESGIVIIDDD